MEQESRRGTYRLGLGLLRLAGNVSRQLDLAVEAHTACEEATAILNETSNVAILDDGAAVNIAQATGSNAVAIARQYVGQRSPLHATSTGKVLAAFSDAEAVTPLLQDDLEAFTGATITDLGRLHDELSEVRAQGWACAVAEWEEETNAVAVPIRDSRGTLFGALSITAPGFRLEPESFVEVADVLRPLADRLGARLGTAADLSIGVSPA